MNVLDHSWVELSHSNLLSNIQKTKTHTKEKKVLAVVKANAYGHGVKEVVQVIQHAVDGFCVAGSNEALKMRKITKKPILVLSYFTTLETSHIHSLAKERIDVPLFSFQTLRALKKVKVPVNVQIKIDTGTSRIGFQSKEISFLLKQLQLMPHVTVSGIYSHFAEAEKEPITSFTKTQTKAFEEASEKILSGIVHRTKVLRHMACSAAIATNTKSLFDAVRLGIHLYGLSGLQQAPYKLKPVLAWKTRLIQVKQLGKGVTIGYGRSYRTSKKSIIGTIPVGYADGLSRMYRNSSVLVKGKQAPVRGSICMNMSMIDLSKIPNVHEGDEVTIIGKSGKKYISADKLAQAGKTINYEVVTRISPTLKRIIV